MKFAFIAHGLWDSRIARGLARSLVDLGHRCVILGPQDKKRGELHGFDVIIEPQHGRSAAIPKDAVFVTWVFEYYGAGDPDYSTLADRDLLYSFGEPEIIGCPRFSNWRGSLTVGVELELLERPVPEPTLDLSLAGFMVPASWIAFPTMMPKDHRWNMISAITRMVARDTKVEPLSGSFDQRAEFERFKDNLGELAKHHGWTLEGQLLQEAHEYGARMLHHFARLANRGHLAKLAVEVSQDIEFWGLNWDLWQTTAKYSIPHTDEQEPILNLYQRSRINLHDNIFGFALHWRVLEAMAVGGFVMAHQSPHYGCAGQMTETFEPETHFGEYNARNFVQRAKYWLADGTRRKQVAAEGRKVVAAKHLWRHRAEQLLKDLAA